MSFENQKPVRVPEEFKKADTSWVDLAEQGITGSVSEASRGETVDTGWVDLVDGEARPSAETPTRPVGISSFAAEDTSAPVLSRVEASGAVSPERIAEAEGHLAVSRGRLGTALAAVGEAEGQFSTRTAPEESAGVRERISTHWASAKRKALITFVGLGELAIGSEVVLGTMKVSAERILNSGVSLDEGGQQVQTHAMQMIEMINGIGVTGIEVGLGMAFAVPMVLLGLAKLKERSMNREV